MAKKYAGCEQTAETPTTETTGSSEPHSASGQNTLGERVASLPMPHAGHGYLRAPGRAGTCRPRPDPAPTGGMVAGPWAGGVGGVPL